jgi:hypothetical protein
MIDEGEVGAGGAGKTTRLWADLHHDSPDRHDGKPA